jgi:8-oxo-dGTP pyrophosphatase MutT (NUDIX family)
MSQSIAQKVIVYCVHDDRLLVFRHVDYSWEEVGIQIPAGSITEGESVEAAALRELQEETGFACFAIDGMIGTARYVMRPCRHELRERHFVRARPTASLPERWKSQEDHGGSQPPTRFECFWIPLKSAHVLQAGQSAMLWRLPSSRMPRLWGRCWDRGIRDGGGPDGGDTRRRRVACT